MTLLVRAPRTQRPGRVDDSSRPVRRRQTDAGLVGHTTGPFSIHGFLKNGGTLEHAQQIAAHESPRTTKLYDRTTDQVSLDEIERTMI